jgi:transcriptional regulator with XRE-family HTH domain
MSETFDFGEAILAKLAGNQVLADRVEVHALHARIAMAVYDLRTRAGMSQKQLAELVGSRQSVISRIEDSDYEGHSLTLLGKIAKALGKRLDVSFIDARPSRQVESTTFTPQWSVNRCEWKVRITKSSKSPQPSHA